MSTIIEVTNLSKSYGGTFAVRNVSFSVKKGEVVGFVGLNGAGKSTTINMLMGFQRPTAGKVSLFGENIALPSAHRSHQRIGFATGDMSLFDDMTGLQYLHFIARSYGATLQTDRYAQLVRRFEPQLDKSLRALSRGNRQKIALIAAFMMSPDLIILDEPSSGLDPLMQQHFIELVRSAAADGATVFMSSHYLNEVTDVCTRILLIKDGEVVKDIATSELEDAAGKLVTVVAGRKIAAPKLAELTERTKVGGAHSVSFVYRGSAPQLQAWLGTIPQLQDFSVTSHSTQAAFEDLYKEGVSDG